MPVLVLYMFGMTSQNCIGKTTTMLVMILEPIVTLVFCHLIMRGIHNTSFVVSLS